MDQAKLEKYANWLVQNKGKKGTPEFDTVANAYKEGRGMGGASQAPAQPTNYQAATEDPNWIKNARTLYKEVNKADPKDDYEATTFLKDYLYDFNYRLAGSDKVGLRNTFGVASDVGSFSPEGKQAFLDSQKTFEGFDVSLPGMMEAGERVLTDPTSFLGITGFGGLARQGVKAAATEGVEQLAKIGVKRGATRGAAVGAAEGGVYAGAADVGQQMAQVNAGGQQSTDPTQTMTSAGFGALAGGGLGGVAGGVGGYFAGRNPTVQAARQIVDDPEKAVRGAEITQRLADVQGTRDVPMGLADVNQVVDLEQQEIIRGLKNLGLPKDKYEKLTRSLKKSRGISPDELEALRSTPEGDAVAENILRYKQVRDMTAPRASEGGIRRAARVGPDYLPVPRVVGDAIKYAVLKPRVTGEEAISSVVDPRNLKIAQEITRLKGPSKSTVGRQWLLDQGLKMARARQELRAQEAAAKLARNTEFEQRRVARKAEIEKRRADSEAARLKRTEEANAQREERARQKELQDLVRTRTGLGKQQAREADQSFRQNVRTNTGLGRQQNSEIAKQERAETEGFKDALESVNAKMRMQQRLDNQRVSELRQADQALAKAQAAQSAALNEKKGSLDKALRAAGLGIKALQAHQKLKARSLSNEAADAKPYRSRKFTKASQEDVKETRGGSEARQERYDTSSSVRNPQSYQAGIETIMDFQRRALDAADDFKDPRVGKLLKRAIEDMVLAKDNQGKRQEAYDKAADAALEISPEALDFIDEQLYFLVNKYANK